MSARYHALRGRDCDAAPRLASATTRRSPAHHCRACSAYSACSGFRSQQPAVAAMIAADASLTKHQHRDLAVRQDLLRHAAKKERLDAVPAVRCHHYQVATLFLRRRDNRLVRA